MLQGNVCWYHLTLTPVCTAQSACKIWSLISRSVRMTNVLLIKKTTRRESPGQRFHCFRQFAVQFRKCFPSPQSTRDIESRMKNETRLKLFTLDPDTQVN